MQNVYGFYVAHKYALTSCVFRLCAEEIVKQKESREEGARTSTLKVMATMNLTYGINCMCIIYTKLSRAKQSIFSSCNQHTHTPAAISIHPATRHRQHFTHFRVDRLGDATSRRKLRLMPTRSRAHTHTYTISMLTLCSIYCRIGFMRRDSIYRGRCRFVFPKTAHKVPP